MYAIQLNLTFFQKCLSRQGGCLALSDQLSCLHVGCILRQETEAVSSGIALNMIYSSAKTGFADLGKEMKNHQ